MSHEDYIKEFSNGEITIVWNKVKCIHDCICVQNLSSVFQPDQEPDLKGAPTLKIIETVSKCTTGALKVKIGSHEWV